MNANSFLQLSIVLTWGCNLLLALTALRINRMKRQREQLAPGIRGGIERDAINGRINRAYRHVQILLGGHRHTDHQHGSGYVRSLEGIAWLAAYAPDYYPASPAQLKYRASACKQIDTSPGYE